MRTGRLTNGLPARVKRQGKSCERLMPMRGSATTSASDIERLGELARTGTEAANIVQTAPRFHQRQTTPRFERANQYKPAAFAAFDQEIQHPVDAVIKIDVDRAGFVALDERSRARAREGMTRL